MILMSLRTEKILNFYSEFYASHIDTLWILGLNLSMSLLQDIQLVL